MVGDETSLVHPPLPDPDGAMALGIGALSRASGIPVETLRTWERRYGFPTPTRTAGNQRLYSQETVLRLSLVSSAMELGHRASAVVRLEPAELLRLPGMAGLAARQSRPQPAPPQTEPALPLPTPPVPAANAQLPWLTSWMDCVRTLDAAGLDNELRRSWSQLGSLRFLTDRTGPFLVAVGESWVSGEISIAHEHFASEKLRDFLGSLWTPLAKENRGQLVVCATLPGEQHSLGLHMAACVAALAGMRVLFLGSDVPLGDIARASLQSAAPSVLISVSSAVELTHARNQVGQLRRLLRQETTLVVGGSGAPRGVEQVLWLPGFADLWEWAAARA